MNSHKNNKIIEHLPQICLPKNIQSRVYLAWSVLNSHWLEVKEGEEVIEEIEVFFPLRRLPTHSFVSLEEAKEWLEKKERSLAKNRALRLLARQTLASTMLFQKLHALGYSVSVCNEIVALFKPYFSDEEYWVRLVEKELARGHGPRLIAWKWKQKGLPEDLLEKVVTPDKQKQAMKKQALKIKDRKQAFRALTQRGFDPEVIADFMKHLP